VKQYRYRRAANQSRQSSSSASRPEGVFHCSTILCAETISNSDIQTPSYQRDPANAPEQSVYDSQNHSRTMSSTVDPAGFPPLPPNPAQRVKTSRSKLGEVSRPFKRRCVSSACIACRRRKSKACCLLCSLLLLGHEQIYQLISPTDGIRNGAPLTCLPFQL